MKNIEIYNQGFFKLPKKIENNDYIEFVSANLDEYLTYLDKFKGNLEQKISENRENINALCSGIKSSIDYYLKGLPNKAYETLETELNKVKNFLLYPKGNKIQIASGNTKSFYKLRYSNKKLKNSTDMFHVPFQLRHLVQSYRYSIPGTPCVYIGSSLDLCWKELREPNICFLYGNRYEIDFNNMNYINLTFTPQYVVALNKTIKEIQKEKSDFEYSFLEESIITWPLSFVCSIPTQRHNVNFKIEYIIPQLLMQWIQNNTDLDGILYFSTVADYSEIDGFTPYNINIAMPVKSNLKTGNCPILSKKLKMTNPIEIRNFRHLKKISPKKSEMLKWLEKSHYSYMNFIHRSMINKKNSLLLFEKIEMKLIDMEVNNI